MLSVPLPCAGGPLMSGRNSAAADENRPPGGPDADTAVPDGPRAGRVVIEVESAPGATTISVRGELDLVTMPFLAEQLTLVSRNEPGRLVFDLAGTGFMDCASARLMAGAGEWLPEGGRPVIRRPSPGVRRVLELTGLDTWKQADERLDK
jgi:anti-sigma B factor antagonist